MSSEGLKIGEEYRSKKTGRRIYIIDITSDKVFYRVEGFDTISPLFLATDKFLHLVGIDAKTR